MGALVSVMRRLRDLDPLSLCRRRPGAFALGFGRANLGRALIFRLVRTPFLIYSGPILDRAHASYVCVRRSRSGAHLGIRRNAEGSPLAQDFVLLGIRRPHGLVPSLPFGGGHFIDRTCGGPPFSFVFLACIQQVVSCADRSSCSISRLSTSVLLPLAAEADRRVVVVVDRVTRHHSTHKHPFVSHPFQFQQQPCRTRRRTEGTARTSGCPSRCRCQARTRPRSRRRR